MYSSIIIFNTESAATETATILREEGCAVRVSVENANSKQNGKIKRYYVLQSPFDKIASAKKYLSRVVSTKPDLFQGAITCPTCSSSSVEYPDIPQSSALMKGIGMLSELTDCIFPGKTHHKFHCKCCSNTWEIQN